MQEWRRVEALLGPSSARYGTPQGQAIIFSKVSVRKRCPAQSAGRTLQRSHMGF